MPAPIQLKYRAFLSYAHADQSWGRWLHRQLEGFRIDKDLVGRETALGAVPKTLRPIFRDREDFSGGHSLNEATIAALDASAALIVLCSPVAATRPAVNEEVRLFRWRHPGRPVIPVLVDGTYPDNFPPALRFEVTPEGEITERPVTLLGADLRETADGKSLGLAKVVAALTGVPVDDIRKRQAIADKQRTVTAAAGIAVFAALALLTAFLFFQHQRQDAQLEAQRHEMKAQREQLAGLVERLALISPARADGTEKAIGAAVADAAKGAERGDRKLQQALELLKAGNVKDAASLFRAVAEERSARLDQDKKDAALAYRNLGAIAGLADPKAAREAYAKALEYDPSDLDALYWHGYLSYWAGQLANASGSLDGLMSEGTRRSDARAIHRAHVWLGMVAKDRGNLPLAREHEEKAVTIAARESATKPQDSDWQRELSEAQIRLGVVLFVGGNLTAGAREL